MQHELSHSQRHSVYSWAVFPSSPSPCSQEKLGYFTLKHLWVVVYSNQQAEQAPDSRVVSLLTDAAPITQA